MVYKSDSKGLKWSRRLNWSKNIRNSQVLLEMALSKIRFMQFTLNLTNPYGNWCNILDNSDKCKS